MDATMQINAFGLSAGGIGEYDGNQIFLVLYNLAPSSTVRKIGFHRPVARQGCSSMLKTPNQIPKLGQAPLSHPILFLAVDVGSPLFPAVQHIFQPDS